MKTNRDNVSHIAIRSGYYGLVAAVVMGILYCLYLLFVPLLVSVLLTFLLDPAVNYLETRGMKRLGAILTLYICIIAIVVGGLYFVVPRLIFEGRNFAENLPEYKAALIQAISNFRSWAHNKFPHFTIPDFISIIRSRLPGTGGIDIDALIEYSSSLFSILSVLVIIPVVTFFLLLDGYLVQKALLRVVPNRYFEMFFLLFHKITSSLKLFIRGQLIDAVAVGIMTTIFLAPVLPYSIVIGLIAGLGNLIPYLGPIIGFIPALFVLLVHPDGFEVWRLGLVLGLFVLVQFIEGTFVYPFAVGKSVDLHPLIVIMGVAVGGQLGGVIGMLIAVPIISIAKVSLEVLYTNLKSYSVI